MNRSAALIPKLTTADWPCARFAGPRIIGHRGASYHATENTLAAFRTAALLGADMWELDARLTADGVCVVSHDDSLMTVFGADAHISALSFNELRERVPQVPSFAEVMALATETGCGLYIELKAATAGPVALQQLREASFTYAAIGSFIVDWVKPLAAAGCEYPLSVLVPVGADPFAMAAEAGADAIHLCWERASNTPQTLVTPELLSRAAEEQLEVVLWHEERPAVIQALMQLPILAVCSDRPELLVPYPGSPARPLQTTAELPQPVCHRGAELIAPENTLAALARVYEQGFQWAEVDVQETADGELVLCHDETLERTTDGSGPVTEQSLRALQQLDAGGFFSDFYRGEPLPTLQQVIQLAKQHGGKLYIELKGASPEKVLAAVNAESFIEDCFFWSFSADKLQQLRRLSPQARIMAREEDFSEITAARDSINAWVIEVLVRDGVDLAALAAQVEEAGCQLMFCYQGDDPDVFTRLIDLRPALINQRHPEIFKQQLYRYLCKDT
ncbi:glycerophosphodiester phosphodiesterase [Aliamphritea hakodatensis]|uniref:glycerophosphodiester phosphodiesterase n=1 Tax=Aliamphritea hakodatensis TaxID=2895352 RepID=UPI0022FDA47C|nr:glycerophosphodiester phosphodiesterase family protein [Aliamphritea hakodatensis]